MCRGKIQRQNIQLAFNVGSGVEVSADINVDFTPDEMHLKHYSWSEAGTSTEPLVKINSTLIKENPLVIIPIPAGQVDAIIQSQLNITHEMNGQINGKHKFSFLRYTGQTVADVDGYLVLHLEFVKYL